MVVTHPKRVRHDSAVVHSLKRVLSVVVLRILAGRLADAEVLELLHVDKGLEGGARRDSIIHVQCFEICHRRCL